MVRIVIVSSLHEGTTHMKWNDIHYHKASSTYRPFILYAQSKLSNIMHAMELSRRVKKDGINVYSLHPGKLQDMKYVL